MSAFRGTPGEWYVEPPEDGGRVLVRDARRTIVHVPPCNPYHPDAIADAHLIAAAPKLLAACQAWGEGFTEGEEFTPEQFRVWVNERRRLARGAIAAALTVPEV